MDGTTDSSVKIFIFAVIFFVVFILCWMLYKPYNPLGSADKRGTVGLSPLSTPPISVTAVNLYRAYEANEVAADGQYKGKRLLVSGEVDSIDKNFMGHIVVHILTGNQFSSAMANLDDAGESRAAQLSRGQSVILLCEGAGRILGSPSLDKCSVQ